MVWRGKTVYRKDRGLSLLRKRKEGRVLRIHRNDGRMFQRWERYFLLRRKGIGGTNDGSSIRSTGELFPPCMALVGFPDVGFLSPSVCLMLSYVFSLMLSSPKFPSLICLWLSLGGFGCCSTEVLLFSSLRAHVFNIIIIGCISVGSLVFVRIKSCRIITLTHLGAGGCLS